MDLCLALLVHRRLAAHGHADVVKKMVFELRGHPLLHRILPVVPLVSIGGGGVASDGGRQLEQLPIDVEMAIYVEIFA